MYPGYRFMDSYPQPRIQTPYAPQYDLNFGAVPPQMKVDPARSLINYECWPYGGSYGHPYPVECHGCCHHNQFPCYHGFRPSYPHFAPPPSVYCHGSYPAFPGIYPSHCLPSHYSEENSQYEYDKNGPRDRHCCGCPNHICQQKDDRNVKIEEQYPDDENKRNDSLVPSQLKNLPYPVVWNLPGYMMNKEGRTPIKSESKEWDKYHCDDKANGSLKSFEQEPSVWNGWLPINISNLGSLKQGGDGKRTQQQQNEDKSMNSFPIFWMPNKPEQVERMDLKEMNGGQKSVEEPSRFRISPLKLLDSDDRKSQLKAREENSNCEAGSKMVGNNVVQKMIPVKQMEQSEIKKILKDAEEKDTDISVEHTDTKGVRKPSDNNAKRQSSPPKTSKLPPVCLRVDPLPKRKNNNGSSRSPSPPANKGLSYENSKFSTSSTMQENGQRDMQSPIHIDKSKEGEQSKSNTKSVKVIEGTIRKDQREDLNEAQTQSLANLPVDPQEKVPMNETTHQCAVKGDKGVSDVDDKRSWKLTEDEKPIVDGKPDCDCESGGDKGASNAKEVIVHEANRVAGRKKLSEAEAAAIIQSAYRGFEVRRWEPLKKLKEIAKINEQVTEVKGHVQDLIFSSDFWSDHKPRVVIGETIMSLLLKLDTIQGLHPSVRDIRKSVAKDLVSLQEKLDSLTIERSEASTYEVSEANSDDACKQGKQQAAKDGSDHESSAGSHDVKSDLAEPCHGQSLPVTDVKFGSVAEENSELIWGNKEACGDLEEKFVEPDLPSSIYSNNPYSEPLIEPKDRQTNEVPDVGQEQVLHVPEDREVLQVKSVKLPLPLVVKEECNLSVEVTAQSSPVDSGSTGKATDTNELVEVPQRVLDQDPDYQQSNKSEQIDSGRYTVKQDEPVMESSLDSPGNEVTEMNQVKQQPGKLLNEWPDVSEQKDNDGPEGVKEKDGKFHGKTMLELELLEVAKGTEVIDTNEPAEVYEVEGKVGSVKNAEILEDARLEMKELSAVGPETEEQQPELSFVEDICEDKHKESLGLNNADDSSSQWKDISNICEEKEEPMEEAEQHSVDQNIAAGEEQEMLEKNADPEEFQLVTNNDNVDDMHYGYAEIAGEKFLVAKELVPARAAPGGELSVLSNQVSSNTKAESDRKLIEENERLRKMMEKLIEAGEEQLTAISNLSGRVKDLEKKLSRKKNLKMRKNRVPKRGL